MSHEQPPVDWRQAIREELRGPAALWMAVLLDALDTIRDPRASREDMATARHFLKGDNTLFDLAAAAIGSDPDPLRARIKDFLEGVKK